MTVYQHIAKNKRRSVLLTAVFVVIVLIMGYVFGQLYGGSPEAGYGGVFFAVIVSTVMAMFSYFAGDKMALWSAGAQEITKEDNPYVWRMVENLAMTAGLPMPRVHIIPDSTLNAFATGRDPEHASIALTSGIIQRLENEELEGVIAHELSHIQNYDIRLMTIVIVLVGAIALMADWVWRARIFGGMTGSRRKSRNESGANIQLVLMVVGVALMVLAPFISQLIQLAISRKREFLADASGMLLTRYSDGLIRALEKIGAQADGGKMRRANRATAHLFLSNPFGSHKTSRLFATHPPIEERIAALRQMGGQVAK